MIKILSSIFCFFIINSLIAEELKEDDLDKIENIVIQSNPDTFYNDYYKFDTEDKLNSFYDDLSLSTNNYYNSIILNTASNNFNFPENFSQNDYILYKINKFYLGDYSFSFHRKIFNSILFDSFINPKYNEFYLNFLFDSARLEELCSFYINLNVEQKKFYNNIIYSSICLLESNNLSQLELLLELYDQSTKSQLNTIYLDLLINNNLNNIEIDYANLDILDKYIVYKNPDHFKISNISINNILDIEIALKSDLNVSHNEIYLAFSKGIFNKNELISILNKLESNTQNSDFKLYNEISSKININDKLKLIDTNLSEIQMNYYDFSKIISDQFDNLKLLNANLKYPKAIFLLLLNANNLFIDNFLDISHDYEYSNQFDNLFFEGIYNFMNSSIAETPININNPNYLNNPALLFFIQNNYLKINLKKDMTLLSHTKLNEVKNYTNFSLYNSIEDSEKSNKELLILLKEMNFSDINELDLLYLSKGLNYNKDFRQLFFNILIYSYLDN
jgi:hypothetical protein